MSYKKIIVREPNWLGDMVMSLPFLDNLRFSFPTAEITVMCKPQFADVLQDRNFKLLCVDTKKEKYKEIIKKIKKENFDLGILLTNSFSSAYIFWCSNIKIILGFKKDWRSVFLDIGVKLEKKGHLVNIYNQLLLPINGKISNSHTLPTLTVNEEEKNKALSLLQALGVNKKGKIIGVSPSSSYGPAKCWPKENFIKVAQKLLEDENNTFLLFFGDDKSYPLIEDIVSKLGKRALNMAGRTTIQELMMLTSQCSVFLTNDSGPMHVAAALNVPIIALFGSTDQNATGPCNKDAIVLDKHLSCAPCFKKTCPFNLECMRTISVEEVIGKVKNVQNIN